MPSQWYEPLYEGVRKRHVGNSLDVGYLENPKIGQLVESIQRITIRAEVFGQTLRANRAMEHPAQRHSIHDAALDAQTNNATGKLVYYNKNQWVRSGADSPRNKSQLHKLSLCDRAT